MIENIKAERLERNWEKYIQIEIIYNQKPNILLEGYVVLSDNQAASSIVKLN